jgi:hypothetical protein
MSWFFVDDQAAFHPKVVRAGNSAFGAWVRFGAYCNAQLTDGFVPDGVASLIASRKEIDGMIAAGMLRVKDGGFEIHDYLNYQPSKADVLKRREAVRERVKRHRNTVTNALPTLPLSGSVSGSLPIPEEKKPEEALTSPPAPGRVQREQFDLEAIYAIYPRKGDGKGKGLEKLERQIRNRETYEQALQAARNYAAKVQAEQTPLKFVKQFVTWCNGHWRDYIDGPHIVTQQTPARGSVPVSLFSDAEDGVDEAYKLRKSR